MLTKNEMHNLYIIYTGVNNQDVKTPEGLYRFDFGLPYIKEKLMNNQEYLEFLTSCEKSFIEESVFDDKYLAYKRWQELLNEKVKEISEFLGA